MLALLTLLTGCSWNLPVDGETWLDASLWDPDVKPANDGVYVRLPWAGELARVGEDGSTTLVDLDGASPDRLVVSPDGSSVLVSASWPVCDDDDPAIRTSGDCPDDELHTGHELDLVQDGERVGGAAIEGVDGQQGAYSFSPDNGVVALYYDFSDTSSISIEGVLDINAITFLDLESGETHPVSVGFPAESVLISPDSSSAVVLSRSEVAVVALEDQDDCDAYSVCVSYALSLDADINVEPSGVALMDVADSRYALVTIAGRSDLYILNLTAESIDIKELGAEPSAIAVVKDDEDVSRAVVVYADKAAVDVIDDQYFEVAETELDEPKTGIIVADHDLVLYNAGGGRYKDLDHFDPASGVVQEERAENPVSALQLADADHLIATMGPETSGGSGAAGFYDANYVFGIYDVLDGPDDELRAPVELALESAPVGLATTEGDAGTLALLLLSGVDQLLQIDVETGLSESVDLEAPPLGLVATPAGGFVVTHDSAAGLLSFLGADGSITTAAGFATTDLFHDDALPRRGEAE